MAFSRVTDDAVARLSVRTIADHLEPRIDAVLVALRARRKAAARVEVFQDPAKANPTITISFEVGGPEFV